MKTQKYNTKEYVDRYAIIIVNRIIDSISEQDFFLNCLDDAIWCEVNDICNKFYLDNNNISKKDVAVRCRELIKDIYNIYIDTGEFWYEDWDDAENRSIDFIFDNHQDPYSYSDSNEQLSASLDSVCFAIANDKVDTLLDSITARLEQCAEKDRTYKAVEEVDA